MKKFLLSLSLLVLFVGCGTNNIVLKKDSGLIFNFADKSSILSSKIVESKSLRLSTIDIQQHKLQDDNNRILFYEEIATDDDYSFRYTPLRNIEYIFNAKKSTVIYDNNTILLAQIELPQGEHINVMSQSNNMENFSYVYGFSNYEFKKIAREITKDSDKRLPSLRKQGMGVRVDDMPLTRWSETKLIVKPFTTRTNDLRPIY